MEIVLADQLRDIEAETQTISDSIMSPFCPGRTLSACPSGQAKDLRTEIGGWLKQGYTEDAVYNLLRTRYGESVTGVPEGSGFGLVGWFAPGFFLLFSLLIVMRKLRSMRGAAVRPQTESDSRGPDPAGQSRVEAELKQRMSTRR